MAKTGIFFSWKKYIANISNCYNNIVTLSWTVFPAGGCLDKLEVPDYISEASVDEWGISWVVKIFEIEQMFY